jgi:two-component system NtrC family sensor kinase
VGLLVESFNEMSRKISEGRNELEQKLEELKNTQATLIHSAKMASLGQLVAGVAHELNNPIGFIYSNIAHLREYIEKLQKVWITAEKYPDKLEKVKKEVDYNYIMEDLPKLISSCEDGARRTRDIVLGLRNFSRLDEALLKRVDLKEGMQNTIKLLASELKNRITVHEEYGEVSQVKCYASQLNQVFMNIISNAAQAIEKDGEIWIKTWQSGKFAYISIKDSGPGIPKDAMDKIFDPFFTTKPVGKGTGLGLSISYGIVQKHGGSIEVNGEVNKETGDGTEFIVKVPVDGPSEDLT